MGDKIIQRHQAHGAAHFQNCGAKMRQQGDVFHDRQFGGHPGFEFVDIKPGPGDLTGPQCGQQGAFVDDIAAGDVDQDRPWAHLRQRCGIARAFAAAASIYNRRGPGEGIPAMALASFVGAARVGRPLLHLARCGSTNDEASAWARGERGEGDEHEGCGE